MILHTQSRIYQRAIELLKLTKNVIGDMPAGYGFLADHMRRSSASVLLNFAEGCGKRSKRERQRCFCIAKSEAYEVAAVLDAQQSLGVIKDDMYINGKDICDHLGAMLSKYK